MLHTIGIGTARHHTWRRGCQALSPRHSLESLVGDLSPHSHGVASHNALDRAAATQTYTDRRAQEADDRAHRGTQGTPSYRFDTQLTSHSLHLLPFCHTPAMPFRDYSVIANHTQARHGALVVRAHNAWTRLRPQVPRRTRTLLSSPWGCAPVSITPRTHE